MISIPLLLTEQHVCSYLDDEIAQPAFVHPAFDMTQAVYSRLIQQGFRRSGDEVYSPHCPSCSACIPVRVSVSQFKPNRSQKRCLQKNRGTQVTVKPAEFDQHHYDLYVRYQCNRHQDGSMQHSGPDEYLRFLKSTWCETRFLEFTINDELAAVAVVDNIENALSAVYTFFEPKFSDFSPGMYAVLWQIEWAKQQELEFLYLGFWVKQCRKMSYKSNYQPLQQFKNKEWFAFNGSEAEKT
jgi:arginine-tRNA-protein transferase